MELALFQHVLEINGRKKKKRCDRLDQEYSKVSLYCLVGKESTPVCSGACTTQVERVVPNSSCGWSIAFQKKPLRAFSM